MSSHIFGASVRRTYIRTREQSSMLFKWRIGASAYLTAQITTTIAYEYADVYVVRRTPNHQLNSMLIISRVPGLDVYVVRWHRKLGLRAHNILTKISTQTSSQVKAYLLIRYVLKMCFP